MAPGQTPAADWRPAPFAKYGPDRQRILLEHALALCCLLVFAAVLLPRRVNQEGMLALPVEYQCVELARRSPAIITVNLPPGEYEVDPESLGYFEKPGEFVYTAAVARGIIYGRVNGKAIMLEVAAPEDAQAFIQHHLEVIRASVIKQNRQENLLGVARWTAAGAPDTKDREVIKQYRKLGQRASRATAAQASLLARRAKLSEAEAAAAIRRLAPAQAKLKELYYAGQRVRLETTGQQAVLQLALARLPHPQLRELLSLGDPALVQDTLQAELAKLESAWEQRLDEAQRELARALPGAAGAKGVPPGSALEDLTRAIRDARRGELEEEAAQLERSLSQLELLRSQIKNGKLPEWVDVPRLKSSPRRLAQASLASLPGYSRIENLDGEVQPTLDLLAQLCCRFAGTPAAGPGQPMQLADGGYPFELPYGLLAVDLALRQPGITGSQAGARATAQRGISQGLQGMLASPDSFGLAQHDLAYLRCLAWYAGQVRDAAGGATRKEGGKQEGKQN